MERQQLLESWLKTQFPGKHFTLKTASADASFRSYFRIFISKELNTCSVLRMQI